jgi:microcystin-dependent protein
MAHILEDRVLESTTTTGTGALTLAGAITGFRAFSAVCAVNDTVPYFIEAVDSLGQPTGDYEWGTATYSGANTLTRTTVLGSSNAGAAVNFAAGSKNVGIALTRAEVVNRMVPAGAVMSFAMTAAPTGWLECDGSTVSRTTYATLFAAIGTTFGAGDGSTTFKLPDLRGEFIRGYDDGRGVDSGRVFGSSQADDLEAHSHTSTGLVVFSTNAPAIGAANPTYDTVATDGAGTTGTTGGTETRPRNVALMYCIKA